MKEKSSNQKTSKNSRQAPAAGDNATSITPPAYGMDALDHSAPVIQHKADPVAGGDDSRTKSPNRTGLPDALKSGTESLSGLSLDDVRVHPNSSKPAQFQALAYTQGSDIHVAPGQERHLPHEAWHVVQQKQGRVKPTIQMKGGVSVNDDAGLEHEADVMGKASHDMGCGCAHCTPVSVVKSASAMIQRKRNENPIQRKISIGFGTKELPNVEMLLLNVLELDSSIPGTINEFKTAITDMMVDETERTLFSDVIGGLRKKMVAVYKDKKNIASIPLRMKFPDKAFLDSDSAEEMEAFTQSDVLGKDTPSEIGYLVDPKTAKVIAAGLGSDKKRVVEPHEIGVDGTQGKWVGRILVHSHPSGSPHTIPPDITAALDRKAVETIVLTRNFTFSVKIDYENQAIKDYIENPLSDESKIFKQGMANASNMAENAWQAKAKSEGYGQYVYNKGNKMNPQEKSVIESEFEKKEKNPKNWTIINDYSLCKFMGFLGLKEAYQSKGLEITTTATEETFLDYVKKFYTYTKPKKAVVRSNEV